MELLSDKELDACNTLLKLPSLISAENRRRRCTTSSIVSLSWGVKRKRTVDAVKSTEFSSPSPSDHFSFCPSESDERPPKVPKQIPEAHSEYLQERVKKLDLPNSTKQMLIRRCGKNVKAIFAMKAKRREEMGGETKSELKVSEPDVEMELGPTQEEPNNNIQSEEVATEETIAMSGGNTGGSCPETLLLFPGGGSTVGESSRDAALGGGQFCANNIIQQQTHFEEAATEETMVTSRSNAGGSSSETLPLFPGGGSTDGGSSRGQAPGGGRFCANVVAMQRSIATQNRAIRKNILRQKRSKASSKQ